MHAFLMAERQHLPIRIQAFGSMICCRRVLLGLTCKRAATMTGITTQEWIALEQGDIPVGDSGLLRSIAATLEMQYQPLADAVSALEHHFEGR